MKTSAVGRAALVAREGCILKAYRDSVGVLTIGVGHTGRMAPPAVTLGMTITRAEADQFLAADLAPVERALATALKVPVTQNEWDAMASWLFNVGIGYAKPSTTIIRQLNLGDVKGAAAGFDLFHRPPEIIGRRNQEKAQFLRPDPAVFKQRSAVLGTAASDERASARSDTKLAAGAGVVAAGIAITQPAVQHHHALLWIVFGLAVTVAVGAAITAALSRRKAATLAANAETHDRAATGANTTDTVDSLQH